MTAGDQDPQVPTFRTSTQAVQLNVIVTDESGNPVAGLTRDDFEVYEERVQRPIITFKAFDIPIEVADPLQSDLDRIQSLEREVLENLAGGGRLHAAGMPFEQSNAELRFEARDVLADGRLGSLQLPRQRAHAAGLAGGDQDAEIFERHAAI